MYYVYILRSEKTGKYYTGYSENSRARLFTHNKGLVRTTRNGVPWKIIHEETFSSRQEAYRRERQIKRYKSGNAFKSLIS